MSAHYYAHKLAQIMREGDGATISLYEHAPDPTSGYVVGGEGQVETFNADREIRPSALIRTVTEAMRNGHRYIGAWKHEGAWYVEPVAVLRRRESALNLARARGELAIYDLFSGEEVWL